MRAFPCYPLLSLSHCISFVLFYSFLYFFSLTFFAPQILRNILPAARLGGSQAGLPGKAEAATLDAKLARTITGLHALPPILNLNCNCVLNSSRRYEIQGGPIYVNVQGDTFIQYSLVRKGVYVPGGAPATDHQDLVLGKWFN